MAATWDFNTAMAELNGMRDFPSFISTVNDAFYYPGVGALLPLLILAILGIATYGKTQNISTTVLAITFAYLVLYPYISDQLGVYMQVIFGLLVLGSAYVLWRSIMRQG